MVAGSKKKGKSKDKANKKGKEVTQEKDKQRKQELKEFKTTLGTFFC